MLNFIKKLNFIKIGRLYHIGTIGKLVGK